MKPHYREELDRASAASAAIIAEARESCRDSATHVRSSRQAIQRSLTLLGRKFFRTGAIDD